MQAYANIILSFFCFLLALKRNLFQKARKHFHDGPIRNLLNKNEPINSRTNTNAHLRGKYENDTPLQATKGIYLLSALESVSTL